MVALLSALILKLEGALDSDWWPAGFDSGDDRTTWAQLELAKLEYEVIQKVKQKNCLPMPGPWGARPTSD